MSSIWDWSLTPSNNDTADADVNWVEGQLPSTVNNSARQMMTRIKELLNDLSGVNSSTGSAGAYSLSASSSFETLTDGLIVAFKAHVANTAAATINVNLIGSKSLRRLSPTGDIPLVAGDICVGGIYALVYSSTAAGGSGGWIVSGFNRASAADLTGTISDTVHGERAGGALHANATTSVAGFMSSADKTKLDSGGVNPPGTIILFAANTVPSGYLKCNGAAISRATYAALFSAISTTHGAGDGSTTFNVPDLRGEFVRGFDDGRGVDSGRVFGSAQAGAYESHTHTASSASAGAHTHTASTASAGAHTHTGTAASDGAHTHTGTTASYSHGHTGTTAAGGAHNHTFSGTTSTNGNHSHSIREGGTGSSSGFVFDDSSPGTNAPLGTNDAGNHNHTFSGTTSTSATHTHTFTTSSDSHTHAFTTGSAGAHTHAVTTVSAGAHTHTVTVNSDGAHTHGVTVNASGSSETRPRNKALVYLIKT
ncbi:tail fiber protein [Phyllobacterium sp. SB3]|uniref:tail fiber protein n=1 Tax=Phyllobacterium sp. SB3 TaxID=3156073 RepID=UPI0032AFC19A